jgi:hypothetical protein
MLPDRCRALVSVGGVGAVGPRDDGRARRVRLFSSGSLPAVPKLRRQRVAWDVEIETSSGTIRIVRSQSQIACFDGPSPDPRLALTISATPNQLTVPKSVANGTTRHSQNHSSPSTTTPTAQ